MSTPIGRASQNAPVEPAALIRAAERASNACDLEAVIAVYAQSARFDVIVDGARELHVGAPAIRVLPRAG